MTPRNGIAIEIGSRHFRALHAACERGKVYVRRALVEAIPPEADTNEAVGAWIGRKLGESGFPSGRVTVVLAREHVGLKRLVLPTVDPDELPDMARLALQRELPFDAHRAIIDYVPIGHTASSTTVMAVAAPQSVLDRPRAIIDAARLGIERIGLRVYGSTTLLTSTGVDDALPTLAVDITGDGVEFSVLEDGVIRFSRAAPLAATPDVDAADAAAMVAESIITETRRTWMSYRIVEDASDVARVVLMGDRAITRLAADPIGEMLSARATSVDHHPLVESGGEQLDGVWPLAGALLAPALGVDTVDFARPRQPVDHGARLRRRALMAFAALVVVLFGAWTLGRRSVRELEHQLGVVTARQQDLRPQAYRYQRDTYTLAHLKRWQSADVRWLDHVRSLQRIVPPPSEAVLDAWVGTVKFDGVRFDKKKKEWSAPMAVSIVVEGEVRDRATADALREALVRAEWYTTSSTGADTGGGKRLPFGFTYRLTTDRAAPPGAESAQIPVAMTPLAKGGDR